MKIAVCMLLLAVVAVPAVSEQDPGVTPDVQHDTSCVRPACGCSDSCVTWNIIEQVFTEKSKRLEMENTIKEMQSTISSLQSQISTQEHFRCETGQLGKHESPAPSWPLTQTVTFKEAFLDTPTVTYGLNLLDSGYTSNLRVVTQVKNVTNTGFDVLLKPWADTTLYGARISWMACGR